MQESRGRRKMAKLLGTVVFFSLLVFWNPKGFFSPVRGFFLTTAYPFQKSFYFISREIADRMTFLGSISDLKNENEELIKENNSLVAEISHLRDEKKENEILREQLKLAPREKFDLESGFVISQDSQKLGNWIMIDKGSASGIERGMPVIVSDGILLGRVEDVSLKSSKVTLLSNPSSSVNVVDLETGAKGIVRGEYGLGLLMDMVSQTDALNEGETIVTSGLGGGVPRGLFVGKIRDMRDSGDKLFQQASIVPRVKYANLEVVFVIKNK